MASTSSTSTQFTQKLAPFSQNAWSRFDSAHLRLTGRDLQEQIEQWARAEARTFFHIAAGQYPFVRIYSALARFANVQAGLQQQREEMAKQNKIMEQTQYESVRVVKPASFYEQKLEKFARVAWTRYDSSTDIANWARTEARTFYHLTDGAYPFVSTWQKLVELGEQWDQEEAEADTESEKSVEDVRERAAADFTEDGEPTRAELRAGRAELNRILFRERARWWDAFQAEEVEDMEEDAPTASERFSQHCAKILNRRTDIPVEELRPVVEGWVQQHSEH